MRICLATTTFPRWSGDGRGAFIWELAKAVQRRGGEVCVETLHVPEAKTYEVIEGIEIHRSQYWWSVEAECLQRETGGLPITLRKYRLARVQLPVFSAIHAGAIARSARTCDVVHAHWTVSGAAALVGRVVHRRPVIITVQGSDIFQVPKIPVGAWLTRTILNRAARVTTLTNALKAAAVKVGVVDEKIEVIPNGVDVHEFVPPVVERRYTAGEREHIILFVGSLIQRKGVRYLLDAISLLPQSAPRHRVVVVGSGPEESALRRQAGMLNVSSRVDFLGFLPQAEIRSWMQRARVFVLPSLEEGQGVVLVEALASGTPVIASDVDGIREVVTREVGVRTEPANPEELATALHSLLADDLRWQEMSKNARKRAEDHYDWDMIADRFMSLYKSAYHSCNERNPDQIGRNG